VVYTLPLIILLFLSWKTNGETVQTENFTLWYFCRMVENQIVN
jgi:hypothetical protein